MSTETNLALVRRVVADIWNGLDLDLADRLFDPFYINHGGIIPDLMTGPDSMKFAVVLQHTAFPRLQVEERGIAVEGNIVELKWVARRRSEPGRTARRPPVRVAHGTTLIRCADDQIAESWTTWDCPADGNVTDAWAGNTLLPYRLAG